MPFATQMNVALARRHVSLSRPRNVLTIHGNVPCLAPGGQAQMERKTLGAGNTYFQRDFSLPRILCHLAEAHVASIDLHASSSLSIVMDPDIIRTSGIKVPTQACERTRQIWRTAGTSEPGFAMMMPGTRQGVLIEKVRTVQGETAEDAVE